MTNPPDAGRQSGRRAGERMRIIRETTGLLEDSIAVSDKVTRNMLTQELDRALGVRLQLHEVSLRKSELAQLAIACVDHTGGLRSLAECLDLLESDLPRVYAVYRLADEWQVIEQFAQHDLRSLRTDLLRVDLVPELRSFIAEHYEEPLPPHCVSAWHAFAHLASAAPADSGPSWLRFLERLTTRVTVGTRPRLRSLIDGMAGDWGEPEPAAAPRASAATPDGTAYLVIQLERYGADEDTFILSHWYQWASPSWQPKRGVDRHVRRDGLEEAVDQVVLETERRWAKRDGPVAIEFVLPSQLLNVHVDRWHKDLRTRRRRLALHYPLVIRSLERIQADEWHREWRGRWRTLREATRETATAEGLMHCASSEETDVQLEAALERDGKAVVLVLNEPPLPDTAGEEQLLVGLQSGIPAIVWFRNPDSAHGHDESRHEEPCEVVSEMLNASFNSAEGVAQLPRGVAELRREAWSEDPLALTDRMAHRLVILWDDPERLPSRIKPAGSDSREVHA
jgi:hypothetical protein